MTGVTAEYSLLIQTVMLDKAMFPDIAISLIATRLFAFVTARIAADAYIRAMKRAA
jgi:hypothetical protein